MPALAIAGVSMPVSIDSLTVGQESVGNAIRNQLGTRVMERRRVKQVVDFDLAPRSLDEANLYRALILGAGEYWPMVSSGYGSKGLLATGTGAWASTIGAPWAITGGWNMTAGQTLILPALANEGKNLGGTLVGWRYSAGWRIAAFSWRSGEGVMAVARERIGYPSPGAAQTYTGADTVTASANSWRVTNGITVSQWGDLLLLPWFLPVAQVDQLMAGWSARSTYLPTLPAVGVTMDLFPNTQSTAAGTTPNQMTFHGDVRSMPVVPHWRAGTFDKSALALSATLTEV